MRKLLLLALLLYDIIALATRSNAYEYDDIEGLKRQSFIDDRRNWRKKALMKSSELDPKEGEGSRRHEYDLPPFLDNPDLKDLENMGRQREDKSSGYRSQRRYDNVDKANVPLGGKSNELGHSSYLDKEPEKKPLTAMNCDRPHERFEPCFAGCASVTCDNPRERLHPCYPFCEPGCTCVAPYVRDDRTHKCVLPDDCTRSLKGIPDLSEDI